MAIAGPGGVDAAIASGIDLDGSPIPQEMLALYNEVMDLESQRARSGVKKSGCMSMDTHGWISANGCP